MTLLSHWWNLLRAALATWHLHRAMRRRKRTMNHLILLLLSAALLCSCAGPRTRVPAPSTVQVARAAQSAGESTRKASASVERARTTAASVKAPLARLAKSATPEQRPDVLLVSNAVSSMAGELAQARVSLQAAEAAQAETLAQATDLQGRIDGMADDLGRAQDAERKSRDATGFWRAWALRLAALSGILLIWTFRKPILRLCGVPAL